MKRLFFYFVLIITLAVFGGNNAFGQNTGPGPSPEKNQKSLDDSKTNQTTTAQQSNMKVTFDETAPGVVIVESPDGEKIRIDATKKTVARINEPSNTQPAAMQKQETAQVQVETETSDEIEPGEEPYDYRLVNVPTPKSVPKGSWNLFFSHRFTQPIRPLDESGRDLLGFDSFAVSSFGLIYGITDKLYVSASRSPICQKGLCKTIEIGVGYHWLDQKGSSPIALTTYASVEGNDNFTEEYTYNLQAMIGRSIGNRVHLFFSPAVHFNANGQRRFNPRPEEFFPPATVANSFSLPTHGASFGFGANVMVTPTIGLLFEFAPRTGFKLGRTEPIFNNNFNVTGFRNVSEAALGFGIQKNIGRHSFALTFSNTQTTTTSRYNSSNLVLSPKNFVIGFNLFRRF
jgi:hypothetical protein